MNLVVPNLHLDNNNFVHTVVNIAYSYLIYGRHREIESKIICFTLNEISGPCNCDLIGKALRCANEKLDIFVEIHPGRFRLKK